MAFTTKYSPEEIRVFRCKDQLNLIQSLIKSYSTLNEGSGKELDLKWVKNKLKEVNQLASDMVDELVGLDTQRIEREDEEIKKTDPLKN